MSSICFTHMFLSTGSFKRATRASNNLKGKSYKQFCSRVFDTIASENGVSNYGRSKFGM